LKNPFNFNINEKYTVQEDTSYPANATTQRIKLYKNFKYPIVSAIAMLAGDTKDAVKLKKTIDSTQTVLRKKFLKGLKEIFRRKYNLLVELLSFYQMIIAKQLLIVMILILLI